MKAHRCEWLLAGYEGNYAQPAYDCKEILRNCIKRGVYIGIGQPGRHNMIAPFKGLVRNTNEIADAYPKIYIP